MSSLAFCVKVRTFFLPKGRNLLTSLKLRPTIRPFLVENVSREVRVNSVVLRQIHVKPSDCKFTPQHSWDRVASEFTLVYETSLKNWIWGFYFCQMLVVPMYLWMLGYKLPRSLEEMPADSIGSVVGSLCAVLTVLAVTTFLSRFIYIRIYYDSLSGQFVAVRRSCFGRLKKICYTVDDINFTKKPDMAGLVRIKGKKCFLFPHRFVSPVYYNMHMQVDGLKIKETYVQGPKF